MRTQPMFSTESRQVFRSDAAPTEAQMRLAIAQTLSQPFAYNAPVVVLDFDADEDGVIMGRFKDAARPRVFSFEIDGESISYKPFVPGRMDSLTDEDVEYWEEFSDGYSFRVDAGIGTKKAQCVKPTAYNCGSACINVNKDCKSSAKDDMSKGRIKKLASLMQSYMKEYKNALDRGEKDTSKEYNKFASTQQKVVLTNKKRREKTEALKAERAKQGRSVRTTKPETETPSDYKPKSLSKEQQREADKIGRELLREEKPTQKQQREADKIGRELFQEEKPNARTSKMADKIGRELFREEKSPAKAQQTTKKTSNKPSESSTPRLKRNVESNTENLFKRKPTLPDGLSSLRFNPEKTDPKLLEEFVRENIKDEKRIKTYGSLKDPATWVKAAKRIKTGVW